MLLAIKSLGKNPTGFEVIATPANFSTLLVLNKAYGSPTSLIAPSTPSTPSAMALLSLAHTQLDPALCTVPTGETSALPTNLVVTALGHRAEPSAPWYDPALGHICTLGAHIVDPTAGRIVRSRTRAAGR